MENSNLIAPLMFDDSEIDLFIRDHRCAFDNCNLVKQPAPDRKWYAICLEHGAIMGHTFITTGQAEIIKNGVEWAKRDLRPTRKPRKPAVILKELGYDEDAKIYPGQ